MTMVGASGRLERSYGAKYDGKLGTADVAKRVRAELRDAAKAGAVPKGKYSVRTERFSGGSSITVTMAPEVTYRVFNPHRLKWEHERPCEFPGGAWEREIFTAEATGLRKTVEAMLGAYNHDGSDSMTDYFDVKFYAHVAFDGDWSTAKRAEELLTVEEGIEEDVARFVREREARDAADKAAVDEALTTAEA